LLIDYFKREVERGPGGAGVKWDVTKKYTGREEGRRAYYVDRDKVFRTMLSKGALLKHELEPGNDTGNSVVMIDALYEPRPEDKEEYIYFGDRLISNTYYDEVTGGIFMHAIQDFMLGEG